MTRIKRYAIYDVVQSVDAMYRLTIRKQAIKTLQRMRSRDALRVRGELDKLAQNPGRRDIDVTPLRGRPGLRLRVGPWRVIFERDEEARKIDVLRIGPRGDVYKELGGTP